MYSVSVSSDEIYRDRILIIDFCSQYTQLIARRIRELGVYCEIVVYRNVDENFIDEFRPAGIVLSGSPESINRKNSYNQEYDITCVFRKNIPVLGICYGMHVMVAQFGGKVAEDFSKREFGHSELEIIADSLLVHGIYDDFNEKGNPVLNVWMSHSDTVVFVPKDFVVIGTTKDCNITIIANEKKRLYGVQFHPEVTHTIQGKRILERFVSKICSCGTFWKPSSIVDYFVGHIRNIVKNDSVILAFSGGIDSLVTALLLRKAIGNDKLICCFIDNGLLRCNDIDCVKKCIDIYGLNIVSISSSSLFFEALVGVTDPEEKRKIIARVFIEVFEEYKRTMFDDVKWLAQGTIYPDIIESGVFGVSRNFIIKSHHNIRGTSNIKTMKLIEPIKNLFKDEVRNLGYELGVASDMLYRHPFPGPGLGIRIIGEVKEEYCNLLRHADNIFIEELQRYDLYSKISQAFVVFLPIRSVGVMGDVRRYEWVVSLRAIETIDFMTARWVNLPYDFLCTVSGRIINEVDGISRVVYDISTKPPSTVEWE